MPAWYDILAMNLEREIDEAQLLASSHAISALIDREIERGIDSRRIIIAGFSQGGAVAYHAALSYPKPLGGLMALSSYFATHKTLVPNATNATLAIAIFHGVYDSVVSETLGGQALQVLRRQGFSPVFDILTALKRSSIGSRRTQESGI